MKDSIELRKLAAGMRECAYCPHSKYKVGCLVISEDNSNPPNKAIFFGANVENSSYGLTMCAERVAIFESVVNGHLNLKKIICSTEDGMGKSCGACLQVINEFGNKDTKLEYVNKSGELISSYTLKDLLPHPFRLE
jgi:cytidine deaminase